MSFSTDVYAVDGEREVALLGNGETVLEGSIGANPLFFADAEVDQSQLYLSDLEWDGGPASEPSYIPVIGAGPGAVLWLDDVTMRGTVQYNAGDVHMRRSNLFEGAGIPFGFPDATIQGNGGLHLENSSIAPELEHLRIGGNVDIRYSTVAVDGDVICAEDFDGVVRNSIILAGGSVVDACDGAAWDGNAVNTAGFGSIVPDFEQSWFAPTEDTWFRLSAAGIPVFEGLAEWEDGDPVLDAEGDPRPQNSPSTPGVDEP
ncbi:MAG: hypothetical protein AAGA54_03650 [Myxococcota bacterium]